MMNNKCILEFNDTSTQRELDGGGTLHLASFWDPLKHTNQDAIIRQVPVGLNQHLEGKEVEVEPGDKVYVHHFICTPDNWYEIDGKNYAELGYSHIYCKIKDEDIVMIQDYILIDRAYEDESTCISPGGLWLKEKPDEMQQVGIVKHVNPNSNLKPGDKVIYSRLSDYEMTIEGERYLKMRDKDVIGIIES